MNKENTRYQENRGEPNQYITIAPLKELNFEYKRNKFIATLLISNILTRSITFKIKTNAPKEYLVEPAHGEIPGKGQSHVKIIMVNKDEFKERCHDRFMVVAYPSGMTPVENYLASEYIARGNCVITPDRMQKLKLKVHCAIDKEISIANMQDSVFTMTPTIKSRRPLGEIYQTATFSTAETMKNKMETSQFDRLHYIPRRSKLSLSSESDKSGSEKNKSNGDIIQLFDLSGIKSQGKCNTIGAKTLTTITPMFKTNHTQVEFPSIEQSYIRQDLCTDRSCDYQTVEGKSLIELPERGEVFQCRIETLEKKSQDQKKLYAQMLKERNEYTEELNKLKFIYPKDVEECQKCPKKKCTICRRITFPLWQLMLISVACLIIGSVFFSQAH